MQLAADSATARPAALVRPRELVRLARQGGLAVVDQLFVSGTTFLTGVIFARVSSKEQFGLFMLALSVVLFARAVEISVISAPYIVRRPHFLPHELPGRDGSTVLYLLTLQLLAVVAFLLAGGAGLIRTDLRPIAAALLIAVLLQLLREYVRQLCFARDRLGEALVVDSAVALLQVGGMALLASLDRLEPRAALVVIAFAGGVPAIAWLLARRHSYRVRAGRAVHQFAEHWELARFDLASGVVFALMLNLSPWLVAWGSGKAGTAIWAACLAVAGLVNPLLTGAQNFLAPELARGHAERGGAELRRLALRAGLTGAAVSLPYAGLLWLAGGRLAALVYGKTYAGQAHLVAVLGAALVLGAAGFAFSRALVGVSRGAFDLLGNATALGVLLTVGLASSRSAGPIGVAYTVLLANVVMLLFKSAAFLRYVTQGDQE